MVRVGLNCGFPLTALAARLAAEETARNEVTIQAPHRFFADSTLRLTCRSPTLWSRPHDNSIYRS